MFEVNPQDRYDETMCFAMSDFVSGDSLIVERGGERIRGVVVSKVPSKGEITYRVATGNLEKCSIESVIFLDGPNRGWLPYEA